MRKACSSCATACCLHTQGPPSACMPVAYMVCKTLLPRTNGSRLQWRHHPTSVVGQVAGNLGNCARPQHRRSVQACVSPGAQPMRSHALAALWAAASPPIPVPATVPRKSRHVLHARAVTVACGPAACSADYKLQVPIPSQLSPACSAPSIPMSSPPSAPKPSA